MSRDGLPVACTLTAAELQHREAKLLPALARHALERRELPHGVALRFEASDERLAEITRVIRRERLYCRFLRFGLVFEPEGGPLWLEVTGPPGTREFLRDVLGANAAAQAEHAPGQGREGK